MARKRKPKEPPGEGRFTADIKGLEKLLVRLRGGRVRGDVWEAVERGLEKTGCPWRSRCYGPPRVTQLRMARRFAARVLHYLEIRRDWIPGPVPPQPSRPPKLLGRIGLVTNEQRKAYGAAGLALPEDLRGELGIVRLAGRRQEPARVIAAAVALVLRRPADLRPCVSESDRWTPPLVCDLGTLWEYLNSLETGYSHAWSFSFSPGRIAGRYRMVPLPVFQEVWETCPRCGDRATERDNRGKTADYHRCLICGQRFSKPHRKS